MSSAAIGPDGMAKSRRIAARRSSWLTGPWCPPRVRPATATRRPGGSAVHGDRVGRGRDEEGADTGQDGRPGGFAAAQHRPASRLTAEEGAFDEAARLG